MGEDAILCNQTLGDPLGGTGSENLQAILSADALVPMRQQKAWVVNVVAEVMMGKEKIVDVGGLLETERSGCLSSQGERPRSA